MIFEYAADMFLSYYGVTLRKSREQEFDYLCDKYGQSEVKEAIYIACEKYNDAVTALCRIPGILYNRRKIKERFFVDEET